MLYTFPILMYLSCFIKDKYNLIYKISIALFFLLLSLRYYIGIDYISYKYIFEFNNYDMYSLIYKPVFTQEIGFRYIFFLLRKLNFDYQGTIVLFNIISIIYLYKLINIYSNKQTFTLFIIFSLLLNSYYLSALRQMLTLSVTSYYLLNYLHDNNKRNRNRFYISALVMSLIHKSSIVLILLNIIVKIFDKLNLDLLRKKNLIVTFSISLLIGVCLYKFSFEIFHNEQLRYYYNESVSGLSLILKVIKKVILFYICYYNYLKYLDKKSAFNKRCMSFVLILFLLNIIFLRYELPMSRLFAYAQMLMSILIANSIFKNNGNINAKMALLVFIVFSIFMIRDFSMTAKYLLNQTYLPYINIFNHEKYRVFHRLNELSNLLEF